MSSQFEKQIRNMKKQHYQLNKKQIDFLEKQKIIKKNK
jgi:hypothetical protein